MCNYYRQTVILFIIIFKQLKYNIYLSFPLFLNHSCTIILFTPYITKTQNKNSRLLYHSLYQYSNNRGFVHSRSSCDPNQTNAPNQLVALVPTRPTAYGTGFVEYNHNQTRLIMNFWNQPLTWDPN
ncbi:hypothetical protein Hanom_Chr02g00171901 [Helianthus anomalus]